MEQRSTNAPEELWPALVEMVRYPVRTIVPPWSWKAAACSAVVRALAFFFTNLRAGGAKATKAMLVEAVFAVCAGGLIGAISQRLRQAKPLWATALVICFALPGVMTLAQSAVHQWASTEHKGSGLVVSFCLSAVAAAYTWYAMRHGAMLGGVDETTVRHDMTALPRVSLDFLLAVPRIIFTKRRE